MQVPKVRPVIGVKS